MGLGLAEQSMRMRCNACSVKPNIPTLRNGIPFFTILNWIWVEVIQAKRQTPHFFASAHFGSEWRPERRPRLSRKMLK